MDGKTTNAAGKPVAPFLTDEQYEMLFAEPRPPSPTADARISPSRLAFVDAPTTRWDRRSAPAAGELLPPPVPRLDLTGAEERLELDIFAEDRSERSMDVLGTHRPRLTMDPVDFTPQAPAPTADVGDVRSRAVSLAFAVAALTATIALWMIAIAIYY